MNTQAATAKILDRADAAFANDNIMELLDVISDAEKQQIITKELSAYFGALSMKLGEATAARHAARKAH